jgi:hypothetical protein
MITDWFAGLNSPTLLGKLLKKNSLGVPQISHIPKIT